MNHYITRRPPYDAVDRAFAYCVWHSHYGGGMTNPYFQTDSIYFYLGFIVRNNPSDVDIEHLKRIYDIINEYDCSIDRDLLNIFINDANDRMVKPIDIDRIVPIDEWYDNFKPSEYKDTNAKYIIDRI